MKINFVNLNENEFLSNFKNDEQCLKYLAEEKWKDGYICKKCGNTNYCKGKTSYSRRCTRCKHDESATANTIFHRCRLPIREAFAMAYEICNLPEISVVKLSKEFERRKMTCWKLKKKIINCLNGDQKSIL